MCARMYMYVYTCMNVYVYYVCMPMYVYCVCACEYVHVCAYVYMEGAKKR